MDGCVPVAICFVGLSCCDARWGDRHEQGISTVGMHQSKAYSSRMLLEGLNHPVWMLSWPSVPELSHSASNANACGPSQ